MMSFAPIGVSFNTANGCVFVLHFIKDLYKLYKQLSKSIEPILPLKTVNHEFFFTLIMHLPILRTNNKDFAMKCRNNVQLLYFVRNNFTFEGYKAINKTILLQKPPNRPRLQSNI